MLQKDSEPDRDPISSASIPTAGDWKGSDQARPLASLQLALNNVQEIASGRGLWSEAREGAGLSIRIEGQKDTAWLMLSGELDYASRPLIEESLALAQSEHDSVVVDLDDLVFMDSSGIKVFLDANLRVRDAGGRVRVVNVHKHHRVFALCSALSLLGAGP